MTNGKKCWKYVYDNNCTEEKLKQKALIGDNTEFTYEAMFKQWESYAKVFTALGMTDKNKSRVGLLDSLNIQSEFVFYGLNMTGAQVSVFAVYDIAKGFNYETAVKKEKLTDLVIGANMIKPQELFHLMRKKEELGLKNIIILQASDEDSQSLYAKQRNYVPSDWLELSANFSEINLLQMNLANEMELRRIPGALFMRDLLKKYKNEDVYKAKYEADDASVILHTSGTLLGIGKSVALSDKAVNAAAGRLTKKKELAGLTDGGVILRCIDLSASYGFIDQMHLSYINGCTEVDVKNKIMNPSVYGYIKKYGVTVLIVNSMTFDIWMKLEKAGVARPDFSSLKYVVLGGDYVSPDTKAKIDAFIKHCGGGVRSCIGYGMSEVGGACIMSSPSRDDDAIGKPLPGVKILIQDEEDEKYYRLEDGEHTGILYIHNDSLSSGKLDGEEIFPQFNIDGKEYICSNDLVAVLADGSLKYKGRANRYFVNHSNVRFDAGFVETAIASEPGISACALVPQFNKMLHDTVPVLYVKTSDQKYGQYGWMGMSSSLETVRQALLKVFVKERGIDKTNLPFKCVLVSELPYNHMGKVNIHEIMEGKVKGDEYLIDPVRINEQLTNILLRRVNADVDEWFGVPLPEELESESVRHSFFKHAENSTAQNPENNPFSNQGPQSPEQMAWMSGYYLGMQLKSFWGNMFW